MLRAARTGEKKTLAAPKACDHTCLPHPLLSQAAVIKRTISLHPASVRLPNCSLGGCKRFADMSLAARRLLWVRVTSIVQRLRDRSISMCRSIQLQQQPPSSPALPSTPRHTGFVPEGVQKALGPPGLCREPCSLQPLQKFKSQRCQTQAEVPVSSAFMACSPNLHPSAPPRRVFLLMPWKIHPPAHEQRCHTAPNPITGQCRGDAAPSPCTNKILLQQRS